MHTDPVELLYESQCFRISFDPTVPCIICICSGFPRSDEFRDMTIELMKSIRAKKGDYPWINCLVDTTDMIVVDYKDVEWAGKEGDLLLYESGARKIAFIVPDTRFEKFYLNTYHYYATRDPRNQLQRRQFGSYDEAMDWLRE